MLRNKKILIASIIIIIAIVVLAIASSGDKLIIPAGNQQIKVNDFRKGITNPKNDTYEISNNADYLINYYVPDSLFSLVINNEDINSGRRKAENEFLKLLGVSRGEACKLNVSLYVPSGVNNDYGGGKDYKLSFCPGAIQFYNDQTEINQLETESLFEKLKDIMKNPLTVALGAAVIMLGGIIFNFKR